MLKIQGQPKVWMGDVVAEKLTDPTGGVVDVILAMDGQEVQVTATYADVTVGDYIISPITVAGKTGAAVWEWVPIAEFDKYLVSQAG